MGINENLFLAYPITASSNPSSPVKITGIYARVASVIPFSATQTIAAPLLGYSAQTSQPGTSSVVQLQPTAPTGWVLDYRVIPIDNFELEFYQDASTPLYPYQNGMTVEGPSAFAESSWTQNEIIYYADNSPYVIALNYSPYPLDMARVRLVGWAYNIYTLPSAPEHYTVAMMATKPKQSLSLTSLRGD